MTEEEKLAEIKQLLEEMRDRKLKEEEEASALEEAIAQDPEHFTENNDTLNVGIIENPAHFDVGIANDLGNAILFVFKPQGEAQQALGFRGGAAQKLLQSFELLLNLYSGEEEGDEKPLPYVVPGQKKKTPTLH
jgi:hypothetical protein